MAGACGATVHLHYCMGEYVNATLINHDDHECGKCGMKKPVQKKGCCHDEQKTFKTAEHHSASFTYDLSYQPAAFPPSLNYSRYIPAKLAFTQRNITPIHAPPPIISDCPIYLQFRNLRI